MKPDKQVKKEFLTTAQEDPYSYYACEVLEKNGYLRKQCESCNRFFWTVHVNQTVCGDSACQGRVDIFESNPAKTELSFQDVWKTFETHMHERGYASIQRYPVVARWNPTTDFTMASIAAFQPYVVSGEVEPPAKKLVIPQFCLRFGDVDNVGVTGSHCTGFVMIGQKQFVSPNEWDQNQAFEDLFTYLTDVLGLPKEELTLHEDAWAGGGNFGPCMEFFSRGVELCNQVYMMFEQTHDGNRELKLKVLDMGLGQERIAWFTQGTPTMYDAAFPQTLQKLKQHVGLEIDYATYKKFAPYATLLNLDEVEDIQEAWRAVSEKVGIPADELRNKIEPAKALYSVAEHARALLVALTDGALPGNVGGYYNLRVIFRRAQQFIDDMNWDISIAQVARWHAEELQDIFPELLEEIDEVEKLLAVEKAKYDENRKRAKQTIKQVLKKDVTTDILIELYDSQGISPEQVRAMGRSEGISVDIPDNFFKLVNERHEQSEQKTATKRQEELPLSDVPTTEPAYYRSYDLAAMKAHVLKIIGNKVLLDRTIFYPTSGGQLHDTGKMDDAEVVDVYKQQKHVVHVLKESPSFKEGDEVHLEIDFDRRLQLAQHHTAAHVINGASKKVLGNHIWQAGAAKTVEKGRLDITHFEAVSDEEMQKIEALANEIIQRDLPVHKLEMKKSVAEAEFGFRLYQGGAVPGNKIRVIDIDGFDVEACGGTHLNTTGELELIKLLKSTKVQDGVVRIEFVAGKAAKRLANQTQELLAECMELLDLEDTSLLPGRVEELFTKWKKVKKLRKKKKDIPEDMLSLSSDESFDGDVLSEAASRVSAQSEHLPKTITRFKEEWGGTLR